MEESEKIKCSRCHVEIRGSDYFCFNCGYNLKPKPPSTDFIALLILSLKSLLLPPLGIYWGWAYIKQKDVKSKVVGFLAIAVTVLMLILIFKWTNDFAEGINQQMNEQMNLYGY